MKEIKKRYKISFELNEKEYKKVQSTIKKVKEFYKEQGKEFQESQSTFNRTCFLEGLEVINKKFTSKYLCEKCGKRIAITVPRHLRERLDVCKCKD
ncbi:MAG: hypothetical protein QXY45_00825 [Candidatus Aenigmatarchaeota archaeon]